MEISRASTFSTKEIKPWGVAKTGTYQSTRKFDQVFAGRHISKQESKDGCDHVNGVTFVGPTPADFSTGYNEIRDAIAADLSKFGFNQRLGRC